MKFNVPSVFSVVALGLLLAAAGCKGPDSLESNSQEQTNQTGANESDGGTSLDNVDADVPNETGGKDQLAAVEGDSDAVADEGVALYEQEEATQVQGGNQHLADGELSNGDLASRDPTSRAQSSGLDPAVGGEQAVVQEPVIEEPGSFSSSALMWNVESEGADGEVISNELAALAGYDIYALTEVYPDDVNRFEKACGEGFRSVWTQSGNNDRMQIIYNSDRYELVRHFELDEINFLYRYRSPLVAHLKHVETEYEFLVMVNHLARGKEEVRQEQAGKLVEWARDQSLPVLALGDYNFDYVFETDSGNEAFRIFLRDNVYKWLRPAEMIDTNWYDPEGDGVDNYPGSMLDFAFVAQAAMEWDAEFKVVVREGDFPDDSRTSDHRPCEVKFTVK